MSDDLEPENGNVDRWQKEPKDRKPPTSPEPSNDDLFFEVRRSLSPTSYAARAALTTLRERLADAERERDEALGALFYKRKVADEAVRQLWMCRNREGGL